MICIGRGGQIRTDDPLLPKQMRYQAALRPDFPYVIAPIGAAAAVLRERRPGPPYSPRLLKICGLPDAFRVHR
jgi:hypothetical protein